MKCSPEMQGYFDRLEKDCLQAYKIAKVAREKGADPSDKVEVTLAKDLSERVIGLIGVVAPQLKESKAPKRILELEKEYGILDWRVALKIAEEVAQEKFCKFQDKKEALEVGLRTGFAYVTVGVVSAPIEGFTTLDVKKRADGKEYLCINFAGPVRNAGGTAAAVSVIIADYLRKVFGYSEYDPTEKEIKRCHAELTDYHERVTNLQYFPSEEECDYMMRNLPVEIGGEPSEKFEISNANLKDLPRIPTDIIRSGYCLIHSSCIALKAPKLWAAMQEWGEEFNMGNWGFLKEYLDIQKKQKAEGKKDEGQKITPNYTYIKDLVSGRPVLGHPLTPGGFRIRYGRARNSGFSAQAIHPATMHVLNDFVATATQLKVERPGKAAAITSCDSVEGPIVRLNNGNVLRFETEAQAKKHKKEVVEILYLGDLLINYGDFFDRAHVLVPPGYCEEYWALEVEKACVDMFGTLDTDKLADLTEIPPENLEVISKPVNAIVTLDESMKLSEKLEVPLHPKYTYFWSCIKKEQLRDLLRWTRKSRIKKEEGFKVVLPKEDAKRVLEVLGVPHVLATEYVVIEGDYGKALLLQLGLLEEKGLERSYGLARESKEDVLSIVNQICKYEVRDKAGTFMGSRMGRPEKAKMRKMKATPHCLFPVGEEGGRLRSIQSALEQGTIKGQFRIHYCKKCDKEIPYHICLDCKKPAKPMSKCKLCGLVEKCEHEPATFQEFKVDIRKYFQQSLASLKTKIYPDLIKGVRGTSSKDHDAEHLLKGVLRAAHSLYVNKDGTIRYDSSEVPLTHFKPKEIGVGVEKLVSLGYVKDMKGKPLTDDDQVLELKPQDLVLPCCPESPDEACDDALFRVSKFVDDLLKYLYEGKAYYNLKSKEDLVGHYVVGLAPHTSAGTLGRIIGFSKTQGFFAHPLYHAAMRRDCDGDESCYLLLMDALLNFSPKFLPNSRGATMDAPLVLTYALNPAEVDDMAFRLDIADKYSLQFYQAAMQYKMPWEVKVKQISDVLGTEAQFEGMKYTHESGNINSGVLCSAYKTLPSMEEKLQSQMHLAGKIRAVDKRDVARLVIEKHFIRDTKGNLRKFSQQQFRCVKCNEKFRRPPLSGKCTNCYGKIILTVSEGFITKYLEPSLELAEKFDVPVYLKQSLELLKRRVEEVFGKDKDRQEELKQWFGNS
ncbi:DNA polymerase II large subunit [Nanoarchaeota archaeon]